MGVTNIVKPGVVWGEDLSKLYEYAKSEGFAIDRKSVV